MESKTYLLVNSKILPPVFENVVLAKELLSSGKAQNTTSAIKMAGISRSAFYKYKDYVFKYSDNTDKTVTLIAKLSDKAGVFSALTTALYEHGFNIITINQETPKNNVADVSLTVRAENVKISNKQLVDILSSMEGIITIKYLGGENND